MGKITIEVKINTFGTMKHPSNLMKRYFLCLNDFYILLTIRHFSKKSSSFYRKMCLYNPLFRIL